MERSFRLLERGGGRLGPESDFIKDLKARFRPGDALLFICRSGGRSLRAAQAAAEAGFTRVVNVAEGFEGGLDDKGRRTVGGWRGAGLPSTYETDPARTYRPAR
jgi:rhodanese-related sulfurtransferase